MRRLLCVLLLAIPVGAQPVSELWKRGHAVIPTPRRVQLAEGEVRLDTNWVVDTGALGQGHIAARSLLADLRAFHGLALQPGGRGSRVIRLRVLPGAVATGAAPEIDRQGYRLRLSQELIELTGNGQPGLFYGVQTLVQLVRRDPAARPVLPRGVIEDWPTFQLRFLHWDTKHHQDRIETLKRYLDWAARFKMNMVGFELEDKFEYPSHPVVGAPGAFTTAELQQIVDYGLERFIQVVPQIQAPAHMAYVLKHAQFADLRADGNNYQSDLCDPRAYELIFSLYDDVIRATRGVDFFFVSTDEVYYAGIGGKCQQPYNPLNRSLKWVEFVRRAREFLAARGRKMLVWAEYPLLPEHVKLLPPDIIDGVIGEPEYIETENKLGIRQLAYTSMQGSELLFPNHLGLATERGGSPGRLESAFETISSGRVWKGRPIGVFGAAWDDSGLHNETFWLGWSAVAQYGWTPGTPSVEQHAAEFVAVYYGLPAAGMLEIYRSLQSQARAWESAWDRVVSRVRGPGYGNSQGKGMGTTRYDRTLSPPALPQLPDLRSPPSFGDRYKKLVAEAPARALENDRLIHALQAQFALAERNQYNLEVFLALARFIGQHWRLLAGLAEAERSLVSAQAAAQKNRPEEAVGHLVAAYNLAGRVREQVLASYRELVAVYEKSRYPKGRSVGARRFVHVLDDTKDHWADRTPDMSFLIAPLEGIELLRWQKELRAVLEAYAAQHKVPIKGLAEPRLEE